LFLPVVAIAFYRNGAGQSSATSSSLSFQLVSLQDKMIVRSKRMRAVGIVAVLAAWTTIIAAQGKPLLVQTVPYSQRNSESGDSNYITAVMPILEAIHGNYYFEEIPMDALGGRAILGLYHKANLTPPELLARDPDHYIEGLPGATFRDKLRRAREAVGDSPLIRGEFAVYRSMEAVFATLDPFSSFAGVDENIRNIAESGSGVGLFLEDRPRGGSYFIRTIALGSMAQKRGLKPGDELLEINHTAIKPDTPTSLVQIEITKNIQSRAGVTLTLRTPKGDTKSVTLKNTVEPNESVLQPFLGEGQSTVVYGYRRRDEEEWDYWLDHKNGIAIFRLGIILNDTPTLISNALQQMGEDGLKAVILDLRDCPSGTIESTTELAGLFLEEKALIATTKFRSSGTRDDTRSEYRAPALDKAHCLNVPLAVLIGPDTSGAAELVAAALQDHERAKIVGQRSRGKATIWGRANQTRAIRANYSIKLSTGMFFRPSGKNLHRLPKHTVNDDWGVRPDIDVVLPAQMRRQIRAWWFEHDLRPVNSNTATPLDNPRNDPVLDAALRALRQQLQTQ
jgi:carboxyl-terminal processing protease